jgi:hypothetical protein
MKQLLTLTLLFFSFLGFSQANKGMEYFDGWACTKKGDTLRGKICYESTKTGERFDKIFFMDAANAKKRLGPEKLVSYGVQGKVFEYILLEEAPSALPMQQIILGDISLYYGWFPTAETTPQKFFYEKGIFLKRKEQEGYFEVLEKKFQKSMATYFKGDDDIVKLIKDNDYEAKDIEKIVTAYNAKK